MKLKYIIPSLVAAITMLVSCSEKYELSYLDGLKVSSSFLAISADGGSTDFTICSDADWEIQNVPDWLTFSPQSGNSGETKVVVSAPATTSSNTATVKIVSGLKVQEVNVSQTAKKTDPVIWTVAQGLAALKDNPDGISATVKGIVCKIDEISPQYGNATYYLSDDGKYGDGNWLEVYRGKWIDGANFTAGNEFAVGDEMVVTGTIVLYNGKTPEFTTGSSVVSITKSLIGIEKVEMLGVAEGEGVTEFSKAGGQAKITVNTKGNGFHISIPEEAKSWLHIVDFGPNYVTLEADANTGNKREVTVTLSTEAEGTTYTCSQSFTQEADVLPHGENPEDPFTVAEAIAKCKAIGNTTDGVIYYAKGIISSISSVDTGSYGNATFNISDDGTDANALTVFRSFSLNNEKFTSEDEIAVGDEVVITGKLVYYKDKEGKETPEFSGNVYVYSRKSGAEANLPGTLLNPFTPAQASEFVAAMEAGVNSETDYYIKGKVVSIAVDKNGNVQNFDYGTYGNASFYISEDGSENGQFYIFRTLYLGNKKWEAGAGDVLKVGDEVVICGKVVNYKGDTPETVGNQSYIYSLNGATN